MVAELPVDSGTFMAAMMLQVVVAGSLLVAMGTCIVYGFFEMRRREQPKGVREKERTRQTKAS